LKPFRRMGRPIRPCRSSARCGDRGIEAWYVRPPARRGYPCWPRSSGRNPPATATWVFHTTCFRSAPRALRARRELMRRGDVERIDVGRAASPPPSVSVGRPSRPRKSAGAARCRSRRRRDATAGAAHDRGHHAPAIPSPAIPTPVCHPGFTLAVTARRLCWRQAH